MLSLERAGFYVILPKRTLLNILYSLALDNFDSGKQIFKNLRRSENQLRGSRIEDVDE